MSAGSRLPKLIAFDLDYTLWDFWIDFHITPPILQDRATGTVYDSSTSDIYYGRRNSPNIIEFYRDVPGILRNLRRESVTVAACSRTPAPKLAMEALRLMRIPNGIDTDALPSTACNGSNDAPNWTTTTTPAINFFDQLEIYPTDKTVHFEALHKKTGLPYSEMLFFDDERRNRNVEKLGVMFILVPEGRGVDNELFEKGLNEWRKRHPELMSSDTSEN
ncbi:magnesium-dependent phosphatase-1 [Pisolithus microcarpus]|nr:magnesium-dependent phosphatase-1 [Pisolithus microcarpus]KAI6018464.1 magnesium-dependent phosphatase-1 [Pisolithus microcarpus]